MAHNTRPNSWTVMAGLLLVALGVWLLLSWFVVPLVAPAAWLLAVLGRIGWPLALIVVGALLILRARGGGWAVSGRRLARSRSDRMIGGVLGGFANYLNVDATVVRVVYALLTFLTGFWWGILAYVIAMLVLPDEPFGSPWYTPGSADWSAAPTPPPAPPVPGSPSTATPPPAPPRASGAAPYAAPPVPPMPAGAPASPPQPAAAPSAPAAPEPPAAASSDTEPPEAPQVPPAPTVL